MIFFRSSLLRDTRQIHCICKICRCFFCFDTFRFNYDSNDVNDGIRSGFSSKIAWLMKNDDFDK